MSNAKMITIDISGHTISGWKLGDENNPSLLALHGWLDNANSFLPIAEYLKKDFCIYAIDLPGHGLSSHNHDQAYYHIWDGVDVVFQVIRTLNLSSPYLLGHSMGGGMASLFAGTFPEYLKGLILIEALGPLADKEESAPDQLRRSIEQRHGQAASPRQFSSFDLAAEARQQGMLPVSKSASELLAKRGVSSKNEQHYFWHADQKLKLPSSLRLTEGQVRAFLSRITVPTHLFLGKQGMLTSLPIETRMACVKQLEVHWLEGNHHLHMNEDAQQISDIIIASLVSPQT